MTLTGFFNHPSWAQIIDGVVWYQLGLTLLHSLWQGVAIAALVCAVICLFGLRHGIARYNAYLIGLLSMVAAPVVTFGHLHSEQYLGPLIPAKTVLRYVHQGHPDSAVRPVLVVDPVSQPREFKSPWRRAVGITLRTWRFWLFDLWFLIMKLWLCGVLVLCLRQILGHLRLCVWRFRACKISNDLLQRTEDLTQHIGYKRSVRICQSDHVSEAMALGILRPVILLPTSWLSQMSPDILEAVVAHELSHLRRYDLWVNLWVRIMEILFFFHPAIWWLSRCLRREREYCCDEYAAGEVSDRATYANALQEAGQLKLNTAHGIALGFGARRNVLLSRVRHVLGLQGSEEPRFRWPVGFVSLAITVLFVAGPVLAWVCEPTTVVECDWPVKLQTADRLFEIGQFSAAVEALSDWIDDNRENASIVKLYAEAQLKCNPLERGHIQRAVGGYRAVLKVDPTNARLRKTLEQLIDQHLNNAGNDAGQ